MHLQCCMCGQTGGPHWLPAFYHLLQKLSCGNDWHAQVYFISISACHIFWQALNLPRSFFCPSTANSLLFGQFILCFLYHTIQSLSARFRHPCLEAGLVWMQSQHQHPAQCCTGLALAHAAALLINDPCTCYGKTCFTMQGTCTPG